MLARARALAVLLALLTMSANFLGCSGSKAGPPRKETFPVTGEVIVDGQPAGGLQVTLHSLGATGEDNATFSEAYTGDDGKFSVATYEASDGVPAGDYAVTFTWGEWNLFSKVYEGDKLKGRYSDPKKSEFKITVEPGQAKDMGRIELTSN